MEVLQRLGAQAPAERGHEGSRACIWRCRPFKAHTHTRDWNPLRVLVNLLTNHCVGYRLANYIIFVRPRETLVRGGVSRPAKHRCPGEKKNLRRR